jgi:hypothetical protein
MANRTTEFDPDRAELILADPATNTARADNLATFRPPRCYAHTTPPRLRRRKAATAESTWSSCTPLLGN